jgi:hypothetical protein
MRGRMTTLWKRIDYRLPFQLSDLTLASIPIPVYAYGYTLREAIEGTTPPAPPAARAGTRGLLLRACPASRDTAAIRDQPGDFVEYRLRTYQHHYIDMTIGFAAYTDQFSSKTRSTIRRKIRRLSDHCEGQITMRGFHTLAEIDEFITIAGPLSARTYQERLLDAGLPADEAFRTSARALAEGDSVRAFLLLHGNRPIAYLYLPVSEGTLIYEYVGYDPGYGEWSPGTALFWMAIESLFDERRFSYFDFTEGEGAHKVQFATHSVSCANILLLRRSIRSHLVVAIHRCYGYSIKKFRALAERTGALRALRRRLRQG